MPQTEFNFTLPVGFVDRDGTLHRDGTMRMATARDEIEPLRDARVRENSAYSGVLRLARVITRLGDAGQVTPQVVEGLYAADFAHLQRLYEHVNAAQPPTTAQSPAGARAPGAARAPDPPRDAPDAQLLDQPSAAAQQLAPAGERGAPLAGLSETALRWLLDDEHAPVEHPWQGGLPLGLRQEQERTRSREALMRTASAPRRGRIEEGTAHSGQARQPSAPEAQGSAPALLRLSSEPPTEVPPSLDAGSSPAHAERDYRSARADQPTATQEPHHHAASMDALCEELIVRLRRELLVERERMGAPFGG